MKCPLCASKLKTKVDAFYFECTTCFAYVKDAKFYISPEKEQERYEEHENDINDVRYQQFVSPITNTILNNFKPQHLGLDYGSGTGPVISKMLEDKKYTVKLYDPFFCPDESYLQYQYDYIFSCEVFEHFYHPKEEITKLVDLLKSKGMLLIMTHLYDESMGFNNWYYPKDPTHVFIYTQKTMEFIAKEFNLDVLKLDERLTVFRKL